MIEAMVPLRIQLSPLLGWLFRSRVRALVARDDGLTVERGSGTTEIAWATIESLAAGVMEVRQQGSGRPMSSRGYFSLHYDGGKQLSLPSAAARRLDRRIIDLIVERAGLEWVQPRAQGRLLPPIAVLPEVAARFRG
jgi:hypothetical protein